MNLSPEKIFEEYEAIQRYKNSIGEKGLHEQSKINERFYSGDQWYGAKCGNDRPLVRHNVIKRIGDYKISALLSNEPQISFSAAGVPNTLSDFEYKQMRNAAKNGTAAAFSGAVGEKEISFIMKSLSDYQNVTASRLKLPQLLSTALKDAFITGSGIIYTYWDSGLSTGLYADDRKSVGIKGDIACETLDMENVCFADAAIEDIELQPYIIISALKSYSELVAGSPFYEKEAMQQLSETGADEKILVLTKLYKTHSQSGEVRVMAVQVANGVVLRKPFDIGIRRYPLALFRWESKRGSVYGESEITYIIPNQIAINRMVTAKVWSALSNGMPLMLVNGDIVDGDISNDPGQIIKVFGSSEDVREAIRYVSPPADGISYDDIIAPIIDNTLSHSGANAAALGDVNPDNTSAIIQLRNAAKLPLMVLQNRYDSFLEEICKIWAEFWVRVYGSRSLKQTDGSEVWYMEFDGSRYADLVLNARVETDLQSEFTPEQQLQVLDKLYDKGAITAKQYLKRLPAGIIGDIAELLREGEEM